MTRRRHESRARRWWRRLEDLADALLIVDLFAFLASLIGDRR